MLNYKEVELLLSEIPFQDSYIQDIRESDYHSFTLSLFNKDKKAYDVYFEIATEDAHFSLTKRTRRKSSTMQRFTQFLKSRIIGARIIEVRQAPWDRAFHFKLLKAERIFFILFRFYSGPGANIIVYDEDLIIEDLMFRRPKRNEMSGSTLVLEERTSPPEKEFFVRVHPEGITFNDFIDDYYYEKGRNENIEALKAEAVKARERELGEIRRNIKRAEEKIKSTKDFEGTKKIADILSSYLHMVRKGMSEVTLLDYMRDENITIPLKAELNPRENLERYFRLHARSQWKRERFATGFHIEHDDASPESYLHLPIFTSDLKALSAYL